MILRVFNSLLHYWLIFILFSVLLNGCGNRNEREERKTQSVHKTYSGSEDSAYGIHNPAILPEVNDSLTDVARFIAGIMPQHQTRLKKLAADSAWRAYASAMDKQWKRFETERLGFMDSFAVHKLEFSLANHNVFYPFSGPDLLHALTFFPEADTVVMVALEPPGNLSIFQEKEMLDSLPQYFASVRQSLHAILNWSFFITKKMFSDLRQDELNGTIHLLLWFAVRRGYDIASVRPAVIDPEGRMKVCNAVSDSLYRIQKTRGLNLSLVKNGHAVQVFYYSADLGDWGIRKNTELNAFLKTYDFSASFVKSASYLLHAANFSIIRELILNHSHLHLQDDSGTPWRFFAGRKEWSPSLFGSYNGPIGVFNEWPQPDLVRAYDSLKAEKLDFGIGYKHRKEESNLMLFRRNKRK